MVRNNYMFLTIFLALGYLLCFLLGAGFPGVTVFVPFCFRSVMGKGAQV